MGTDVAELQKQICLDTLQGRPAVDGRTKAEELIKQDLVERAKLRDAVVAKAKKILKGEAKAESGS